MKHRWIWITTCICMIMLAGQSLMGMPAFARKYKLSCKTCHNPFPRLTDYGEDFAADGFVLKDQKATRYYVETGDKELSLIRDIPIAFKMEGYINSNLNNQKRLDFSAPYLLKLLSGGEIAHKISYYFYFFLNERGKVAGVEDAFIMFSDVLGSGVALSVGQFQVSDPLFKRELRLTFEDYQIYKAHPGQSRIDLTYDRGIMLNFGFNTGTDFTLEVLNGSGIDEADLFRNFDSDKYKNLFGRVSQTISDSLRLGLAVYYGREGADQVTNEVFVWGGDLTLSLSKKLTVNVQYMQRRDDNPYFNPAGDIVCKTRGAFAEAVWTPRETDSKLYGALLWNWVDSDENLLDYHSLAAHAGWLLWRNLRLVAEVAYIFKSPYGENDGRHTRVGIGLITAF